MNATGKQLENESLAASKAFAKAGGAQGVSFGGPVVSMNQAKGSLTSRNGQQLPPGRSRRSFGTELTNLQALNACGGSGQLPGATN